MSAAGKDNLNVHATQVLFGDGFKFADSGPDLAGERLSSLRDLCLHRIAC